MRQVIAHGDRQSGAIRLLNAHIRGVVSLDGAEITNDSGPAVFADGLRTDSTLFLNRATMSGVGEKGAVCLLSAHIGGPAELRHTKITNHSGPALHADRLRTDSTLFLNGATIRGAHKHGALRLPGAHIGGQLNMVDTQVVNDFGLLMTLNEVTVKGKLIFPATAVCPHGQPESGTRTCPDANRQMAVRDLTFPRLDDATWQQWLHLLVHHTAVYRSQPFQQLASVERAAGHDGSARQILITQQDDLRRRTPQVLGGRLGQRRHQLWGWLGRYGYRAHRLVVALFVVLALSGGMAYLAGQVPTRLGHHAAERVTTPAATPAIGPGVPCSTAELLGLGIDRGLPIGTTGLRARCDLDTTTQLGQAFTYALWALQAMLWALATLAAAAYTGLVRKPT
ncbi:hypothetical protein AB0G02_40170 [Actinosynnema sp. NPDC023658]|uniref:hypothetical protein n=1 Tax=Actinosynnema sp. NPDC023658 TaxID=3155465 RepID=UPI0033DC937E